MSSRLDSLFAQVTASGQQITAHGLYSLRREALKDGTLSDHDAEVLQRAVDLYNKTSGAEVRLTFVNLTGEYPGLGATEMTVRFDQGELGAAQAGRPDPALLEERARAVLR